MAHIHFIGGEKGGVGKSLVARILAQYLIDHERPFLGFDTDKSHGALMRFYAGYASPVVVDRYESLDAIVEAAIAEPDRSILVDMAAQTQGALTQWMDDSGLLELSSEMGLTLTYWHVMDSGRDSVDLLKKLLDRFGSRLNYVLVQNHIRGDNFDILEASGEKKRALEMHARIINIKRLHEASMVKIDGTSSSFWSATQGSNEHALGILERQRVKMWLRSSYSEIDTLHL
ncbi:MAG: mobilization protein [Pseudomonadota bacterium]